MWFPAVNFFAKKSKSVNHAPRPAKPKPKEAPKRKAMWVGYALDPGFEEFVKMNAKPGFEKEARQELLDHFYELGCKALGREP